MIELFKDFEPLLRTFWYIAIPTSGIFLIQTILTFMGGHHPSDSIDADFHGGDTTGEDAPFQLFSLRNLINFLLGFSWTGISFYNEISNRIVLVGFALAVGALFVYLFFLVIRQIQKLAEDNSFKFTDTINKSGDVYLTIPGEKAGKGKIMISIKGSVHELDAMTENGAIKSGAVVKVVRIESGNILIVETI